MNNYKSLSLKQRGYTLIELMVSLVLGLIIIGAALQLFVGNLVSTKIQQANAELQDSGVFGLEYVAKDIRLANYGNISNPELTDTTPNGGVVLSHNSGNANVGVNIGDNSLTREGLLSNTGATSDQLTIQFTAPNDMFNCEGDIVKAGEYIIQRYFLRKDANGLANDLALVCDANSSGAMSAADIAGFGDNKGEIIMPRVDHLKVYLGVITKNEITGRVTSGGYYSINQYKIAAQAARTGNKPLPRIVSIKAVVLVRSTNNTGNNQLDPTLPIPFMNGSVSLSSAAPTKHMRRTYMTTVALRNAMGEKL